VLNGDGASERQSFPRKVRRRASLEALERHEEIASHVNAIAGTAAIIVAPLSELIPGLAHTAFGMAGAIASAAVFIGSYIVHVKLNARIRAIRQVQQAELGKGDDEWADRGFSSKKCKLGYGRVIMNLIDEGINAFTDILSAARFTI
jgi:hypothetical protein